MTERVPIFESEMCNAKIYEVKISKHRRKTTARSRIVLVNEGNVLIIKADQDLACMCHQSSEAFTLHTRVSFLDSTLTTTAMNSRSRRKLSLNTLSRAWPRVIWFGDPKQVRIVRGDLTGRPRTRDMNSKPIGL